MMEAAIDDADKPRDGEREEGSDDDEFDAAAAHSKASGASPTAASSAEKALATRLGLLEAVYQRGQARISRSATNAHDAHRYADTAAFEQAGTRVLVQSGSGVVLGTVLSTHGGAHGSATVLTDDDSRHASGVSEWDPRRVAERKVEVPPGFILSVFTAREARLVARIVREIGEMTPGRAIFHVM